MDFSKWIYLITAIFNNSPSFLATANTIANVLKAQGFDERLDRSRRLAAVHGKRRDCFRGVCRDHALTECVGICSE